MQRVAYSSFCNDALPDCTTVSLVEKNLNYEETLEKIMIQEMASLPNKTPVSILQELMSRRGITPNYELVQIEGAIHEPIFRYRVTVASVVAIGTGRSKKEAKHAAAKSFIDRVIGKKTDIDKHAAQVEEPIDLTSAEAFSDLEDKIAGNPIGWLQEMCMSRRWPPPSYPMTSEEGLPHERQFTITCEVLSYKEVGRGKSKKLAKRMAAYKMWNALQDVQPETTLNGMSIHDEDDEISQRCSKEMSRYYELKDGKSAPFYSNKANQFHRNMKQATGEKIQSLQTTDLTTVADTVSMLQEVAEEQKFEVTYVDIEEKACSGFCQCLVQLSTIPVAVCYGSAPSAEEARQSAAFNALEFLKIISK